MPAPETSTSSTAPAAAGVVDDIIEIPDSESTSTKSTSTQSSAKSTSTKATTKSTTASSDSSSAASGNQVETVYVSVLKVTSTTSDDTNTGLTTRANVEKYIASINEYWNTESEGAVTVELGGFEVRNVNESECTPRELFTSVPVTAFDGRFAKSAWKGTHEHLAMMSLEECGRTGLGTIGGDGGIMFSGNGIGDALGVPVLAHEFGHNLGFGHAGSSVCESTTSVDGAVSDFGDATSKCPTDEYGDYLDIMGYSIAGALPHLSSAQRIRNGYLTAYRSIAGYTGTSTVTIGRLDGTSSLRALKVVDPISGDAYYVEYRTPTGTDATSTEFTRDAKCTTTDDGYGNCSRSSSAATGSVRIIRELPYRTNASYVKTTVIAVADPATKKRTTHLDAGDSFTSIDGGFTVVVNNLDKSTGATVSIRMGAANETTTSLAIDKTSQTYGSDDRVQATAIVNRSKESSDTLDGKVGFYSGKTRLATVALDGHGSASYNLPTNLTAGKVAFSAKFIPNSIADEASASSAKTIVINRATATTTIALKKAKVSSKSRAKVAVTVKVAGATPTGKLYAYANGKKVASYTLSSTQKGKATITLPKLTSTKSITVKYAGTGNIEAAASGTKKLSVTK